jgi:hypothetical protein
MTGVVPGGLRTLNGVPYSPTAAFNTQAFEAPEGASAMMISISSGATQTGTLTTPEVQWSNNGTTFYSADPKDTFANLVAGATQYKYVTVKAPFYRVAFTGSVSVATITVQDHPLSYSVTSASGWESGASSLPTATVGYIPATTLAATVVQATPATYTALTHVPMITGAGVISSTAGIEASRMALLVNCTANTWTSTATLQVYWSMTGLVYNASTNPIPLILPYAAAGVVDDLFTAQTAPFNVFKEIPILAPYFALGFSSGTPGSATFTVDVAITAL